jgi:hypothetical protein
MKLLEMPYEILGSMPKNDKEKEELSKSTTLSDFSLGREYIKIGATLPAHQDWGLVTFYLGKNAQFLIGTIKVLVKITNTKQEVRNKVFQKQKPRCRLFCCLLKLYLESLQLKF